MLTGVCLSFKINLADAAQLFVQKLPEKRRLSLPFLYSHPERALYYQRHKTVLKLVVTHKQEASNLQTSMHIRSPFILSTFKDLSKSTACI